MSIDNAAPKAAQKKAAEKKELPSLLYSEVETELSGTIRGMLGTHATWQSVLARTEADDTTDRALWKRIAVDQGLAGLAVPEELGGAGASWREVAVVLEELGRATAQVPYLGSAVTATSLLMEFGEKDLVRQLASGEKVAAVVVPFSTVPGAEVNGSLKVSDGKVSGTVTSVADALAADVLLVPTTDGLYAVDAAAASVAGIVSLDMTRQLADITFDAASGSILADTATLAPALQKSLVLTAALLASEQLGVAEAALDVAVDYVKNRYQFGRLIGSYQALKHRLADVYVLVSQVRAAARYAAACAGDNDEDLPVAASVAQSHASYVAVKAAEECMQLHGGIGFTWENQSHLFLKRAKADSIGLGRADQHRTLLAGLVDLPAS
ncbi:alkylation response protein AidB-like acyl-CoA dehydrogenase [Antricoccus suffuscus]|uniref:Alkylation response protein AidB-like acyl-CoA dehydrogenase n=1 Tax=Antricoccus suffuscus TaxID=1629062 RepID=A0A2T0Z1F8_9ACTN|nr:acyl-CoA dehydrogenase family protein [Antricoccus suffuscus]PRZ30192.1 alkylation response protein AidB-like acyl-CoA dehydrogenase [Antricoccus suffuscus]